MSTETDLPIADAPATAGDQSTDQPGTTTPAADDPQPKSAEQIRIEELERVLRSKDKKIDRTVRQREELRARLQQPAIADNIASGESDSDSLTLSRAELADRIKEEARKLAPTIKQQEAEIEHRRAIVAKLESDLGKDKFDALANDLDDAFDGLTDGKRPKPAVDAIFEADDPKGLIEYLANPDHSDEAEALSRMTATQAGRAIARLEAKLESAKADAKPQRSKAPAPIEPAKGGASTSTKSLADLDGEAFAKRRREMIAARR